MIDLAGAGDLVVRGRGHGEEDRGGVGLAQRPEERLRFDYQKTLAARMGFGDDAESLGVEKMMQN